MSSCVWTSADVINPSDVWQNVVLVFYSIVDPSYPTGVCEVKGSNHGAMPFFPAELSWTYFGAILYLLIVHPSHDRSSL